MRVEPGYEPLAEVLQQALDQSQIGKGKECHANGLPFLDQPIVTEGRVVGPGFHVGQARKKVLEAMNCEDDDRAICDYLGAIVYIAALVILRRERKLSREKEPGEQPSDIQKAPRDEILENKLQQQALRRFGGQILLKQDQRIKAQAQQAEQVKFFNDLLVQIVKYGTGITKTDGKTLEQRVIDWEKWAEFEGTTEFPASDAAREQDIREWACGSAYCEADTAIELDEEDMMTGCALLKFNRGIL